MQFAIADMRLSFDASGLSILRNGLSANILPDLHALHVPLAEHAHFVSTPCAIYSQVPGIAERIWGSPGRIVRVSNDM
jgi:hypothetical protein